MSKLYGGETFGNYDKDGRRKGIWSTFSIDVDETGKETRSLSYKRKYEKGKCVFETEYGQDIDGKEIILFKREITDDKIHGKEIEVCNDNKINWYYKDKLLHRIKNSRCDVEICKKCMGKEFEKGFLGASICKLKFEQDFSNLSKIECNEKEEEFLDECPYYLEQITLNQ